MSARGSTKHPVVSSTGDEIVIYRTADGRSVLDVNVRRETVWLSQRQMAELFDKDTDTVGLHIRNVFREKELAASATTEESSVVQVEGGRSVRRRVRFYNLDVIISVGYRVKSKRGTQFRIWATQVLKDHILRGYTVNEKRLRQQAAHLKELQATVELMGRVMKERTLVGGEAAGLLQVITEYSRALSLLDQYDHQQLAICATTSRVPFTPTPEAARRAIAELAKHTPQAGGLFAREKDDSLSSSISAISQTFDGGDLYPSIEEKAAHLLYFVVKNHSFVDGNKRIGAFLFLWYLDANGILHRRDGSKRLADNTLVALTLLIAESQPAERDTIIKVLVNLINLEND